MRRRGGFWAKTGPFGGAIRQVLAKLPRRFEPTQAASLAWPQRRVGKLRASAAIIGGAYAPKAIAESRGCGGPQDGFA